MGRNERQNKLRWPCRRLLPKMGVIYLELLLAMCTLLPCHVLSHECSQMSTEVREKLNTYYSADEDWPEDTLCCDAASWVVNEEEGTVGFFYQRPRRGMKRLTLEKKLPGKGDDWIPYTTEKFIAESCNGDCDAPPFNSSLCGNEDADQFGYHTLRYISSGEYKLTSCKGKKRYITTKFNESTLTCKSTNSPDNISWSKNGTHANVRIAYQQKLTQTLGRKYTLYNSSNDEYELRAWWVEARRKESDPLKCESDSPGVIYEPNPDTELYEQIFVLNDMEPGRYILRVESFGQISSKKMELDKYAKCSGLFRLDFNATSEPKKEPIHSPPEKENYFVMSMIGVMMIGAFCISCWILYMKCKPRPLPLPYPPGNVDKVLTREKILLLYARDCAQFNDLMVTFRDLLRNSNFEVFDCYDPGRSRQIDKDPSLWMRNLVNDGKVRVVVVSSRCARLQQLALINSRTIMYQEPQHLDRLFRYGLSDVMKIYKDLYPRVFSIAVKGFTEKTDMLALSDSRIYTLPIHVRELIRDLRNNPNIFEVTEDVSSQLMTFKKKLNSLISQKNTQEDYLDEIILQT